MASTTSISPVAVEGNALERSIPREQNPMLDAANRIKLAVFCANVARGTSISFAETLPKGAWQETARLAQAADRAGIDGFIPLARWKNTSRSRPEDDRFSEPFTWAAGLAALTERISVFTTVHMSLFHPVVAAAMGSTIDHISGGRFSMNVVAGFNAHEFKMFGIEQLPHDQRYAYADEWMSLLKQTWTAEEPFDFHGRFFECKEVISRPRPLQRPFPVLMSAGASAEGRKFAARQTDMNFIHLPGFDELPQVVAAAQCEGREAVGRDAAIFSSGYIVCDETEAKAWRRYHYVIRDKLDRSSANALIEMYRSGSQAPEVAVPQEAIERLAAGFNALPLVGTAEQIVERIGQMAAGGLAGMAISFDDYDEGIAAYDEEIRPLLISAGLRSV